MKLVARPLPYAIAVMTLLIGVKTVGLVNSIGIGSSAHASAEAKKEKAEPAASPSAANPPAAPSGHGAKPGERPPEKPPAPAAAAEPAAPAEPPISEAERTTLQQLRARRKELDARAAALDERETVVAAAERRLTERVQQLTALQGKLEQLEKERQARQDANWRGLVRTYEDMRPRDAATIFNDLDSAILVQVLDRMKDAKAAPILASMNPERARAATAQLAQYRNQVAAAPRLDGKEAGTAP